MRILVPGGDGMLGHELLRVLSPDHDVTVTLRQSPAAYAHYGVFTADNAVYGVDVRQPDQLAEVLAAVRPDAVVNAVGLVKQRPDGQQTLPAVELNTVYPHRLAQLCRLVGARLVHVSTDCVFSGRRGGYTEDDEPDAYDVYGTTKRLGEVDDGAALVLRTSIIGPELSGRRSLVEWFLAQRGDVPGFRRVLYSGLTTTELSRVVDLVLREHPDLTGLYHVASEPISKHELLAVLADRLGRTDVTLRPDDSVVLDRSLRADRFAKATGYCPPTWDQMLTELAELIHGRTTT